MKKILEGSSKMKAISNKSLLFSILLTFLFCGNVFADAYNLYYVDTNRISYTGTITTYDSLADAEAGLNNTGIYPITNRPGTHEPSISYAPYDTPYRDAVMMIWSNGAYGYPYNTNDFFTNVYSSTALWQSGNGTGNPNKTQEGLIFITGGDYGSASTSNQGFFHGFNGTNYTEFTLHFTGDNSNLTGSRLWNAPATYTYDPNANLHQWAFWNPMLGTFISYQFDVTFGGLKGVPESTYGGILSKENPTWVDGTFKGIFQNTNSTDPAYDGFYVADFTFGLDNWAYAQGSSLDGETISSTFWGNAQPDPVPAPSTLLLLASGLSGIVLLKVLNEKRRGREVTH